MKKLLLLAGLIGYCFQSFAQENYSRVKIFANESQLIEIHEMGIDIDHGKHKQNSWFQTDLSESDINDLRTAGFAVEVLIQDVSAFYVARNMEPAVKKDRAACNVGGTSSFSPVDPLNFELGGMGGYFTYEEFLAELDSMRSKYPDLISAKAGISTFSTHEGRPIHWVRISDNPDVDEAEHEVLYTAIHHAREPIALSQTIYYMWYLLENYGTDEEITYLVDHTEMYFVPMINPDGYKRNQTTNPSGGGMHRKNRNPSVGTTNKGVDLNRNYSYHWDESGTSPNPNNDTYAGSGPFSEPETQAIKWFCENRDFQFAFNAHSYGDWLLFPIGWAYAEFAADHDYFTQYTSYMVKYNGYTNAKSSTLYPAAGDSDDWMYIDDLAAKPQIFAMTPEVGGDDAGFWPPSSAIFELCRETFWQNKTLAHMPHVFIVPTDLEGSKVESITGEFNFELERLGIEDGDVTVSLEPLVGIASVGLPQIHSMTLGETKEDSISYILDSGIAFGDEVKYVINVDNGLWTLRDTIIKTFGVGTAVFTDDCSDIDNWTGDWTFTNETYVSPSRCITESPFVNYQNNDEKECVLSTPIYLGGATYAYATFQAKWDIENNWDYCQFMASTDGGTTWTPLCGKYTNPGSADQDEDAPLYDGTQMEWVLEEVDLSDYLGVSDLRLRFYFIADGGVVADGFYFDDFNVFTNAVANASLNENPQLEMSVYPNPSNNEVNIRVNEIGMVENLMVYNELGQVVYAVTPNSNLTKIDTESWAEGVYTIVLRGSNTVSKKERLVIIR